MNVWVILKGNFICVLIVEVSSLKRPVETENSHLGCQMVGRHDILEIHPFTTIQF